MREQFRAIFAGDLTRADAAVLLDVGAPGRNG
jgi:hypothetical protein